MSQEPFRIRATQRLVFRDEAKNVVKIYEIGDEIEAIAATESYWVTPMGGIYFHEAELVDDRHRARDKPV